MSRWSVRGQCHGRAARSASEARQQERVRLTTAPTYAPVSSRWQRRQCSKLRLSCVRPIDLGRKSPPPQLRTTEPSLVHETNGDGNCLFRCLSLVLTGSESYHNIVRQRIVSHISKNCKVFSALLPETVENGSGQGNACAQYLSSSKMATGATWGSDVEILAAAHLLRTRIFVYTLHGPAWQWVEHGMEITDPRRKACKESIYLMHTGLVHYDLVGDVKLCSGERKSVTSQNTQTSHDKYEAKVVRGKSRQPRHRGCSVPCQGHDPYRRRSQSRSNSYYSSGSNISSRSVSSEGYSSCDESVGSLTSQTSNNDGRRRTGGAMSVSPTRDQRSKLSAMRMYTCNNNNCFCKLTVHPDIGRVDSHLMASSKTKRGPHKKLHFLNRKPQVNIARPRIPTKRLTKLHRKRTNVKVNSYRVCQKRPCTAKTFQKRKCVKGINKKTRQKFEK